MRKATTSNSSSLSSSSRIAPAVHEELDEHMDTNAVTLSSSNTAMDEDNSSSSASSSASSSSSRVNIDNDPSPNLTHEENNEEEDIVEEEIPKPKRIRIVENAETKAARAAEVERQLINIRKETARSQRARLRFLLGQSDLFRHFLEEGTSTNSKETAQELLQPHHSTGSTLKSPTHRRVGFDTSESSSSSSSSSSTATTAKGGRGKTKKSTGAQGDDLLNEDNLDDEENPHAATRLTKQPSILQGTLRDYQLEGLNWMIGLHEHGLNGILADEMGLGKTFQTISLLSWCLEALQITGPHLILVPKSTLSNWQREIKRFCPSLVPCVLHGSKEERAATIQEYLRPGLTLEERGWHICLTTYEVAGIEETALTKIPWQYLIIDEAHRIKNEASSLSGIVRRFVTAHRLLITGTPLQNNLHELWALLNFLLPDIFSSSESFDSWFNLASDTKDEEAKANTIRQLHRILRPFMLRRLKSDVAKTLPPKKETLLYVGMTKIQRDLYKSILQRNINDVLAKSGSGDRTRLANLIMHLRKACNHPYLFEGIEDRTLDPLGEHLIQNCAKLKLLDKLLPRLKEKGSRVLIFSQMTSLLDILEDYCMIRQYEYCRIDGSRGYDEREEAIDSFNAPGSSKFVFLLSTRAGGLGINLATADIVILYDSDWNPQADLQAQDRAHRIGQTKPVQVFRLITSGSIEEKMIERAMMKLKLDAVVVQQGRLADKGKAMSKDDMLDMIQFGADAVFKARDGDDEVTEQDVDTLLAAAEEKTKSLADALEKAAHAMGATGGLLNFKMEAGSSQFFEGIDYSDQKRREAERERQKALREAMLSSMVEETASAFRSAKSNRVILSYNESIVFKALQAETAPAVSRGQATSAKSEAARLRALLPPESRPPNRMDVYTLLDKNRIMEITAMEITWLQRKEELAKYGSSATASAVSTGTASTDLTTTTTTSGTSIATVDDIDPAKPFPQELIDERNALIAEGFPEWRRDDTDAFVNACRYFGRDDLDSICKNMAMRGKIPDEVRRYSHAFWTRGRNHFPLPQYQYYVAKIERGEKLLEENRNLEKVLAAKLAQLPSADSDPWHSLLIPDFSAIHSHLWTNEADRYIMSSVLRIGHGHFNELREAILHEPRFRFDSYLRSRTADDLSSRARALLRVIEREIPEVFRKAQILVNEREKELEETRKRKQRETEKSVNQIKQLLMDAARASENAVEMERKAKERERERERERELRELRERELREAAQANLLALQGSFDGPSSSSSSASTASIDTSAFFVTPPAELAAFISRRPSNEWYMDPNNQMVFMKAIYYVSQYLFHQGFPPLHIPGTVIHPEALVPSSKGTTLSSSSSSSNTPSVSATNNDGSRYYYILSQIQNYIGLMNHLKQSTDDMVRTDPLMPTAIENVFHTNVLDVTDSYLQFTLMNNNSNSSDTTTTLKPEPLNATMQRALAQQFRSREMDEIRERISQAQEPVRLQKEKLKEEIKAFEIEHAQAIKLLTERVKHIRNCYKNFVTRDKHQIKTETETKVETARSNKPGKVETVPLPMDPGLLPELCHRILNQLPHMLRNEFNSIFVTENRSKAAKGTNLRVEDVVHITRELLDDTGHDDTNESTDDGGSSSTADGKKKSGTTSGGEGDESDAVGEDHDMSTDNETDTAPGEGEHEPNSSASSASSSSSSSVSASATTKRSKKVETARVPVYRIKEQYTKYIGLSMDQARAVYAKGPPIILTIHSMSTAERNRWNKEVRKLQEDGKKYLKDRHRYYVDVESDTNNVTEEVEEMKEKLNEYDTEFRKTVKRFGSTVDERCTAELENVKRLDTVEKYRIEEEKERSRLNAVPNENTEEKNRIKALHQGRLKLYEEAQENYRTHENDIKKLISSEQDLLKKVNTARRNYENYLAHTQSYLQYFDDPKVDNQDIIRMIQDYKRRQNEMKMKPPPNQQPLTPNTISSSGNSSSISSSNAGTGSTQRSKSGKKGGSGSTPSTSPGNTTTMTTTGTTGGLESLSRSTTPVPTMNNNTNTTSSLTSLSSSSGSSGSSGKSKGNSKGLASLGTK